MTAKQRPDIRAITRLVPPGGNLVQGQSEMAIDAALAEAADRIISASGNHYSPAEGTDELRRAVAAKITCLNEIKIDADARPLELLITPGATGALVAVARTFLAGASALVFEPYYPYHKRIIEELGGRVETLPLRGETLALDAEELRARCSELRARTEFPLRAIILCTPANPTGKVFTESETQAIADVCREFDLLCISDEVYEHYVVGERRHLSIARMDGMWERTITVNSFSKSWNISGWRLGYVYGHSRLVAPLNNANNVFYVCSPTPLQRALAEVLMAHPSYYDRLRALFSEKRRRATEVLSRLGFRIYDSGSAFYIWARIPDGYKDAMQLNEALIREAEVAGVPGSAFTDSDDWDGYMRLCIAREEEVLDSAFARLRKALSPVSKI
jgi:aminotransferase